MFDIDWQSVLGQLAYDPKNPMIFSTGVFLLLFLGFTLIYNLLGKKTTLRLLFVTAFSYYFYYKSSGFYFYLLFIVTFSDFFLAWLIHRNNQRHGLTTEEAVAKRKLGVNRLLLALSLMVDLGILVYFKYTNFFGNCWANITGGTWDMLDIILPVGVSFFTFQSLSYTFDVYRGKLPALTSFLDYAFFVSFFPQLVAGPIVRASDFIPQIRKPLFVSKEMFGRAIFLIMAGLIKKAIIADYISAEGLTPVHLLCTHFHFDHVLGLHFAADAYGLQPEGSALDEKIYNATPNLLQYFLGPNDIEYKQLPLGQHLEHNNQIRFGNHMLQVIHTPGHSPGCLCFYCKEEDTLWSGDTLFRGSVGRTDLPGGNYKQLVDNIRTYLMTLPESTKVYAGHGPATTIGYEKAYNPYF